MYHVPSDPKYDNTNALFVIPNVLDQILIIDADTIFLKPTTFINTDNNTNNNMTLFNVSLEYNKPYFTHMARVLPSLKKKYSLAKKKKKNKKKIKRKFKIKKLFF